MRCAAPAGKPCWYLHGASPPLPPDRATVRSKGRPAATISFLNSSLLKPRQFFPLSARISSPIRTPFSSAWPAALVTTSAALRFGSLVTDSPRAPAWKVAVISSSSSSATDLLFPSFLPNMLQPFLLLVTLDDATLLSASSSASRVKTMVSGRGKDVTTFFTSAHFLSFGTPLSLASSSTSPTRTSTSPTATPCAAALPLELVTTMRPPTWLMSIPSVPAGNDTTLRPSPPPSSCSSSCSSSASPSSSSSSSYSTGIISLLGTLSRCPTPSTSRRYFPPAFTFTTVASTQSSL